MHTYLPFSSYFQADILVSSAANDLNNPTTVGRALNLIGGPSFVAACSQHTNIMTGGIATTIGGSLPCSYVIHAVCCRWNSTRAAEQVNNVCPFDDRSFYASSRDKSP